MTFKRSASPKESDPPASLQMRDLTREAGISRQGVHHYIDAGLLPPPLKKRRNVAEYSQEHLERLRWIQRLQREHFLSLSAIKAVFNGDDVDSFSPEQQTLLRRVRDQLPGWAQASAADAVKTSKVTQHRVSEADLRELEQAGLITLHGSGRTRTMSQDDADIAECFARYRVAGATQERGYSPAHLAIMDRAIGTMVEEMARVYAHNWTNASAEDAVAFLEAVIPIDERLMATLLRKKMRAVIASMPADDSQDSAPSTREPRTARRSSARKSTRKPRK